MNVNLNELNVLNFKANRRANLRCCSSIFDVSNPLKCNRLMWQTEQNPMSIYLKRHHYRRSGGFPKPPPMEKYYKYSHDWIFYSTPAAAGV